MSQAAVGFGGHPLVSALAAVDGILDEVSGASLWSLSDEQVASLTAGVARVQARVAAVKLALVAEADSRGVASRVGTASTQAWFRGVTRCAPGAAKREVVLARSLSRGLEATREALAGGAVSEAQARVIAEAVEELPAEVTGATAARPLLAVAPGSAAPDSAAPDSAASDGAVADGGAVSGVGSVRARAEAQLVQWARQFDPVQLGKLGRRIVQVVDPDAAEGCEARRLAEWESRAFRRRELSFADDGRGTVFVRGRMDTQSAAVIRRAIDPLAKPRPTDAHTPDDRSPGARMVDALVEVCDRALRSGICPPRAGSASRSSSRSTTSNSGRRSVPGCWTPGRSSHPARRAGSPATRRSFPWCSAATRPPWTWGAGSGCSSRRSGGR